VLRSVPEKSYETLFSVGNEWERVPIETFEKRDVSFICSRHHVALCRVFLSVYPCVKITFQDNTFLFTPPSSHCNRFKRQNSENCFHYFYRPNSKYLPSLMEGRDSSVGIATGYKLEGRAVGVRVPVGARFFTSPRRPDRLWGPPLLSNGYRGLGREAGHSPSTSSEVKNTWIYTCTAPYAFMA
jgi:hypothetical protein